MLRLSRISIARLSGFFTEGNAASGNEPVPEVGSALSVPPRQTEEDEGPGEFLLPAFLFSPAPHRVCEGPEEGGADEEGGRADDGGGLGLGADIHVALGVCGAPEDGFGDGFGRVDHAAVDGLHVSVGLFHLRERTPMWRV